MSEPNTQMAGDEVSSAADVTPHETGMGDRLPLALWALFAAGSVLVKALGTPGGWALERWDQLAQWESATYLGVADRGYDAGGAAFALPVYPLLVRACTWVTGDRLTAAVLVTYASSAAAAWLLWQWMDTRDLDRTVRVLGVLSMLAFPYAFVLYGVVGPDALCLALVLGAFVLVERDQPLLGGLVAAVAVATQIAAMAIVPAFLVIAWLHWRSGDSSQPDEGHARRRIDAIGLAALPLLGPIAVTVYLGVVVGEPGWMWRGDGAFGGLSTGVLRPATWVRVGWLLEDSPMSWMVSRGTQAAVMVAFFAAAWFVLRRFGPAPGVFVAGVVVMTLVGFADTASSGRRLILAFPVFALAGSALARWPRALAGAVLAGSAVLMYFFYVLYIRSIGLPFW